MKAGYESIYLPLSLKKLLIKRCILIDFPHSDQSRKKTRDMGGKTQENDSEAVFFGKPLSG